MFAAIDSDHTVHFVTRIDDKWVVTRRLAMRGHLPDREIYVQMILSDGDGYELVYSLQKGPYGFRLRRLRDVGYKFGSVKFGEAGNSTNPLIYTDIDVLYTVRGGKVWMLSRNRIDVWSLSASYYYRPDEIDVRYEGEPLLGDDISQCDGVCYDSVHLRGEDVTDAVTAAIASDATLIGFCPIALLFR